MSEDDISLLKKNTIKNTGTCLKMYIYITRLIKVMSVDVYLTSGP